MYDFNRDSSFPYVSYQIQVSAFAEVYKIVGNTISMITKVFSR